MIKAENLVKKFDTSVAVNNLSFEVSEGENLVLLGTSGCGKTTTLRMINRLIEPDSGRILLNGLDVRSQQPEMLRRGIGYVLQNHGLFPHYTVAENIAIVPRLLHWGKDAIQKRADELFQKLNLDPSLAGKFPVSLSGGQQQRVGLMRSLMVNPPVLLMDEPFGALDNLTRIRIRKEFRMLDELKKKTIIMVTHDVQEAFEIGDRICLMDKGEIKQIGTPEMLLFHPANDFVKAFFNEQRLQLKLKSISIAQILPNHALERNSSIWDRIDVLLSTEDNQPTDTLELENLMRAFARYKNK